MNRRLQCRVLIFANVGRLAIVQNTGMTKPFQLAWFLGRSFASKSYA